MVDIKIFKKDEAFILIDCDYGIAQELSDYFKFRVNGYQFMPAFKNKVWDGFWRLFNIRDKLLYHGLSPYVEKFCQDRRYSYIIDPEINGTNEFSVIEAKKFIDGIELPENIKIRDYQLDAFIHAIRNKRIVILSSTGSGKSLIIYCIIRYLQKNFIKGLLIVPTISLVSQMYSDFASYGFDSEKHIHLIHGGKEKDSDKFLYISTWQSIFDMPKKYFNKFDFVIGDEAHLFKAKSLTTIMSSCINSGYRVGTTGTLDDSLVNKLVLEGLFGIVNQVTTTSNLIENGQLSKFKIKCLILKYPDETCKMIKKMEYKDEIDYIVRNEARNKFIRNLALSLEGNTLILFQFVEKHGKELFRLINEQNNKKVFYVSGETDSETRELVRELTEKETNAIIIASYGTFSTGINIRNLDNMIFASPSKSKIRNLQSIGRILRIGDNKNEATLFDIADDFRTGTYVNFSLKHFTERIKVYDSEKFTYKFYNINLKG